MPIALLFVYPLAVFWTSGEFLPISEVVARQQGSGEQDMLYESGFSSVPERYYKLLSTRARNPEVIALGKSRITSLSSDNFKNPQFFYNAGRAVYSTSELISFLNAIPSDSLKVILLDISGMQEDDPETNADTSEVSVIGRVKSFFSGWWRQIYVYRAQQKYSLHSLMQAEDSSHSIGISSLNNGSGYRPDGSHAWGNANRLVAIKAAAPGEIAAQVARIVSGGGGFEYGTTTPRDRVEDLAGFLALCRLRHIIVIGYLSPLPKELYVRMNTLTDAYGHTFREMPLFYKDLFEDYGSHFYDLRDPKLTNTTDSNFYDAVHIDDIAARKVLLFLSAREPFLSAYVKK